MDNLKTLPKLAKNGREATKAFWAYDKAALTDAAVPKEYVELMAVAVALTTQCVYGIEIHRKLSNPLRLRQN
jgi:alkylhydroperoxidase/carboxymuconolactone decarboxylase family protein YurZ